VAIRFDAIERNGIEQSIALRAIDDGDRSARGAQRKALRTKASPEAMVRPERAGLFVFSESGNLVLDRNFHSEWETR
jgi:hypothetical protein